MGSSMAVEMIIDGMIVDGINIENRRNHRRKKSG